MKHYGCQNVCAGNLPHFFWSFQMEKLKGYLEIFKYEKKHFLFPFFFQEYIYALGHDHGLNKQNDFRIEY